MKDKGVCQYIPGGIRKEVEGQGGKFLEGLGQKLKDKGVIKTFLDGLGQKLKDKGVS